MAVVQWAEFSVILTVLWTFTRGDAADVEVSCVFMESCILPCSFQPGPGVVIHWIQETTGNTPVHSYYHNKDQLVAQSQRFRGRTSLFQDQISGGNASLRLTGVKVQDEGRYQCYTSTETAAEKTFIILKVEDAADVEVSCVFMESCILPCSFQPGPGVVIHWIQETTGNTPVHIYYRNQDQLVAQSQRFRGRTSLFQDQISGGNASLQLTGVKVQDQGRYQCYTSTETAAEKTFIILKVEDAADVEVSCVFMESCILPCSFQPGPGVVIHWIQETTGNTPVHSYYHNKDQLVAQSQRFRGRTSLFQDQISGGNASLQLTGVKVQDEGRYQCYTSTETAAEKTFIILKVEDAADVEVSCVFMESCILPCSFQPGPGVVIHWIQETTGNTPVHSYYHNKDQLVAQNLRFRGRTSLFQDQISGGNASLQLTGVKVQDQGRYQCYTSTETAAEKTFIILKVEAPVSKVDIQQEGNRITCSSEGIYPEPELTWSTNPPSNVTFKISTTVQQTEQQLYNINSSLVVSDGVTGLDYSCTVSTDRNRKTATLFKPISGRSAETETSSTAVIGSVVGAIVIVALTVLAAFCIYKKIRNVQTEGDGARDGLDVAQSVPMMPNTANGGVKSLCDPSAPSE